MQCSFIATTNGAVIKIYEADMIFYSAIIVPFFFIDTRTGMNSITSLVARQDYGNTEVDKWLNND